LWNSTIDPGQPWVMISGNAFGFDERWWMKWMSSPSISVTNWSNRFQCGLAGPPVVLVGPVAG
jgi:hypothetical protein